MGADCLRAYGLIERWSGEGQAFRYTASTDDRDTWATFRPPMEATTLAGFTAEAVAEGYDLA
ncbi:MAG TPA: hypothetical protein VK988_06250 [Acidimicrobiales bacterium]|nr:hypothetical protein [Acidimicrobiales bacterium]